MTYQNFRGKVYPQDIQCVIDPVQGKGGIYIGNLQASQNLQTLIKHNIGAVLTAAKGIFLSHPKENVPHYLYVPADDHQFFDLSVYFDQSVQFITKSLKETNILVHCMAGISRSVSLVIAYLIKVKGMRYLQAYTSLKMRRRIVNPNRGFVKQLENFQKEIKSRTKIFSFAQQKKIENKSDIQEDRSRRHTLCSFNRIDLSFDSINVSKNGKARPHEIQNPQRYTIQEKLEKGKLKSRVDQVLAKHNYKYNSFKSKNINEEFENYASKYCLFKKKKYDNTEHNHSTVLPTYDNDYKSRIQRNKTITNLY